LTAGLRATPQIASRLPLRRHYQALLAASLGLAVERLRHRSRAAHVAQQQHFDLKVAALVGHPQHVSNANLARSFGGLPLH